MFTLVLVSRTWNGKRSLKTKGRFARREEAEREMVRLYDVAERTGSNPDYRVFGDNSKVLAALKATIKNEQADRRAAGAKKAAATRAKRGAAAYVLCPTCGAKSKKLRSEFGGLETRRCQHGHTFEYDRWLKDRAFWAFVK